MVKPDDKSNLELCMTQNEHKKSKKGAGHKPKRPLSAYNLFFQTERQKLIEKERIADFGGCSDNDIKPKRKSAKMAFGGLARYIAAKWKNIDDDTLAHFQGLAAKEQKRYMNDLVSWKIQEAHERHGTYDDTATITHSHETEGKNTSAAATATAADAVANGFSELAWNVVPTVAYDSRMNAFAPVDRLVKSRECGPGYPVETLMAFADNAFPSQSRTNNMASMWDEGQMEPYYSGGPHTYYDQTCAPESSCQCPPYDVDHRDRSFPTEVVPSPEFTFFPSSTAIFGNDAHHEELVRQKGEHVLGTHSPWRHQAPQQTGFDHTARDVACETGKDGSSMKKPSMETSKDLFLLEPLPIAYRDATSAMKPHPPCRSHTAPPGPLLFGDSEEFELRNTTGGLTLDDDVHDLLISRLTANTDAAHM